MRTRRTSGPWRVFITLVALLAASGDGTGQTRVGRDNSDHYKKWLQEDVVYIISPEESEVFKKLTTPEEKDAFIEQFWARRDTDPKTSTNEFQEAAAGQHEPGLVAEFWYFLKHHKKWWMIPILLVLLVLGAVVFLSGTAAAPFIYTLF